MYACMWGQNSHQSKLKRAIQLIIGRLRCAHQTLNSQIFKYYGWITKINRFSQKTIYNFHEQNDTQYNGQICNINIKISKFVCIFTICFSSFDLQPRRVQVQVMKQRDFSDNILFSFKTALLVEIFHGLKRCLAQVNLIKHPCFMTSLKSLEAFNVLGFIGTAVGSGVYHSKYS